MLPSQCSGSPVLLGSLSKPVLGLFLLAVFSVDLLKVDFLKNYSGNGTCISSVLLPHSPRLCCNITNGNRGNSVLWQKETEGFVASYFDRKRNRPLLLSNVGMSRELLCLYV